MQLGSSGHGSRERRAPIAAVAALSVAAPAAVVAGILDGLDGLRWRWLRLLDRLARSLSRPGRVGIGPLMRRPELRVAIGGLVGVLGALACALVLPLWTLALSPLLLGVPHLLADLRYLVVRPGLHRRARLALGIGLPLLVTGLGAGMPAGLCAVLAALVLGPGATWRKGLGVLLVAAALGWGLRRGFYEQELVLAHAHNAVAVLLWWLWRPQRGRLHVLPLLAFALAGGALALGVVRPLAGALAWQGPAGLSLDAHAEALAPMFEPELATRLVLLYCFAQGVHYSTWLRLIPEEDRERPTPRTFRASALALRAELGMPLLVGAGLAMAALLGWAVRDLFAARVGYFRLALFHGYLELCALALLWVSGRRPQPARP
ncbi:MAG: hypothetical protein U1A78_02605 [Polyangia bacterium]